ncbi:hypothetical protein GCM10022240_06280 [Microbacterium kribbense]|uniref:Uncharacterized protein n=1 Tax=Microbacterium kribbense TaxID=433645 RepID=A0ABP7G4K4_9MICO
MPNGNPEGHDEEHQERKRLAFNVGEPRKRESTGDADKDALYGMTFSQFSDIVEHEGNPLHSKALEVQDEMFAPIQESLKSMLAPLSERMQSTFDAISKSSAGVAKLAGVEVGMKPLWKLESNANATEETVAEFASTIHFAANEMQRRQIESLDKLVEYAETEKTERDADKRETARARQWTRSGTVGAWCAVAIPGLIGLLAWLFPR